MISTKSSQHYIRTITLSFRFYRQRQSVLSKLEFHDLNLIRELRHFVRTAQEKRPVLAHMSVYKLLKY